MNTAKRDAVQLVTIRTANREIYNRYMEFKSLLAVEIVHLVDRADLFLN
jgi:hypothetical protein